MLDSQARIVESPRRIALTTGDAGDAERAASFHFRVQWSTLFVALESAKSIVPLMVPDSCPLADARGCTVDARSHALAAVNEPDVATRVSEGTAEAASAAQWEMKVPKMARPSSKIAAIDETAPPAVPRPEPLTPPDSARQLPTERFRWQGKLILALLLAAGVAAPVLLRLYHPRAQASVDAATRAASWIREPSAPTGAKEARQLVLYRPSFGATDGRLEFTWKVSDRALAWIFRAKDTDNYYAMAIKALRPGPSPALSVEHFTVYQGVESPHSSKVLILSENNPALQIRMDVSGATFKLYLEGNAADYWTDNRLGAGALGFLEQPGQPADVERVRMSFSQAGGA
jgi:hypothetical protein